MNNSKVLYLINLENYTKKDIFFYKEFIKNYLNDDIDITLLFDSISFPQSLSINEEHNVIYVNGYKLQDIDYKWLVNEFEKYDYIILDSSKFTWLFIDNNNNDNDYFKEILKHKKIILFDKQYCLPNNYYKVPFYNISDRIINTSFYSYFNQIFTIGQREVTRKVKQAHNLYTYTKIKMDENDVKDKKNQLENLIKKIKDDEYKTIFATTGTLQNIEYFYHTFSLIRDKNKKKKFLLLAFDIDELLLNYITILFENKLQIFPVKSDNYYIVSLLFNNVIDVFYDFSPIIFDDKYQQFSFLFNVPHITLPTNNAYFYYLNNLNDIYNLGKLSRQLFDFNSNLYTVLLPKLEHNKNFNILEPNNIELNVFDKLNFTSYYTFYANKENVINTLMEYFIDYTPKKHSNKLTRFKYNILNDVNLIDNKEFNFKKMLKTNKLGLINPTTKQIF